MQTTDSRFTGDVQIYATEYSTLDYKIEYGCGYGNNSHSLVYMGMLLSNSGSLMATGKMFTTIQEAVLSMVKDMSNAQQRIDTYFREQFDSYSSTGA